MINIFIDSAAFKAVFDESDEFYKKAHDYWLEALSEEIRFITTNFVLDETYTLFRSHLGKKQALILRDKLASSPKSIKVVYIQQVDERQAWEYFEKLPGRGISFTDCTSFSVMKRLGVETAFTFDGDFISAGFTLVPDR